MKHAAKFRTALLCMFLSSKMRGAIAEFWRPFTTAPGITEFEPHSRLLLKATSNCSGWAVKGDTNHRISPCANAYRNCCALTQPD